MFGFVFLISWIIFKAIKKGKLPQNRYTPFDDLIEGKKEEDVDEEIK